jgi:hypothetical protein
MVLVLGLLRLLQVVPQDGWKELFWLMQGALSEQLNLPLIILG